MMELGRCASTVAAASVVALVAVVACASAGPQFRHPAPLTPLAATQSAAASDSVEREAESTLILIGDAGEPGEYTRGRPEPVLRALATVANVAPERTTIVFLGDNVYKRGVGGDSSERARAHRILDEQIGDRISARVKRIFVPGNHDWNDIGTRWHSDGIDRIRAQDRFLAARANERGIDVRLSPRGGCPGPEVIDQGRWLRLITIDTEWWLQRAYERRANARCTVPGAAADSAASVGALQAALHGAGERHVVVVAHHPFISGGPHGGYCPDALSWCGIANGWVRLTRGSGRSRQDIDHRANGRMRAPLAAALGERPPLLYASGHDHSLQVIEGGGLTTTARAAQYFAVSGAGIYGHGSAVACRDPSRFASSASGMMRLDVLRDGRAALTVLTVDADGAAVRRARFWLAPLPGGSHAAPATGRADAREAIPSTCSEP